MALTTTRPPGRYTALAPDDLAEELRALPGWRVESGHLVKTVEVPDIWTLLERVNAVEEELDHHSVVTLDTGRLTFSVWTHVRPGLTRADVDLAQQIDHLLH